MPLFERHFFVVYYSAQERITATMRLIKLTSTNPVTWRGTIRIHRNEYTFTYTLQLVKRGENFIWHATIIFDIQPGIPNLKESEYLECRVLLEKTLSTNVFALDRTPQYKGKVRTFWQDRKYAIIACICALCIAFLYLYSFL